jgi:hypothetical protein
MKSRAWLTAARIVIAVIIAYQFLSCSGRGDIYVNESMLIEDSVATVHIKNLVDTSAVKVYVNGSEAKKISLINNGLLIRVPSIMDTTAQEDLTAALYVRDNKEANLYSTPITYTKHTTVKGIPYVLYENANANITGKNLNVPGLDVSFNNNHAKIISQQFGKFRIAVPEFADTTTGQSVNVVVTNKGAPVFENKLTITHSIVHLIDYANKATWVGGYMKPDSSITSFFNLIFQDTTRQNTGFVTASQQKMEDNNIYNNVLRTHPRWGTQGTIQGLFPQLTRKNPRLFKAKIGFLNDRGAVGNESLDGASFNVRLHYNVNGADNILTLYNSYKTYNKQLTDVAVKIPVQVPEQFSIELAVYAGNTSNSDWAAWVDPRIDTKYFRSPFRVIKQIIPVITKVN